MRRGRDTDALSRPLGWVSVGLGVTALLAPGTVSRLLGVGDTPTTRRLLRAVGIQEVAAGTGLLRRRRPARWLRARVAGDVAHLALLAAAFASRGSRQPRVAAVAGTVAGVAVADLVASRRLAHQETATGGDGAVRVRKAVTVNRSPEEVYRHWRDLENLPTFMAHLRSVEPLDDNRSRWVATAPGRRTVAWEADIVEDAPGERIAWRSLDGDVPNSGTVRFSPAPGGRGTEVTVELSYRPRGRKATATLAKLFGEDADQQVADDLRRFKQVVETGEVVRSDGSPEGSVTRRQLRQRPAQPKA